MTQASLSGKTILIAEDDPDLREILTDMLTLHGAKVLAAENGPSALALLGTEEIHMILSDMRMPGGDGMELLKGVRSRDVSGPPFIFLTGYSDVGAEVAIAQGAQDMLPKPYDNDKLVARMLDFLS